MIRAVFLKQGVGLLTYNSMITEYSIEEDITF